MKTLKKAVLTVVTFFSILFVNSCGSDDVVSVNTPSSVTNTVTLGTWKITLLDESGVVKTSDFSGYNFTFGSNNTINATNGTNVYSGAWSVSDDNVDDDSISTLHFNISFSSPANFVELTEDWKVLERTDSTIKLIHKSGGNGSTDFLTFTKI